MPQILRSPPPHIIGNKQALNAWFASLSPQERGAVLQHTQSVIDALPPQRRRVLEAIATADKRYGTTAPIRYLGAKPEAKPFDWGGLATGIAQVGGALWGAQITGDIQKDMAKEQADSAVRIAQIQADSGAGTQALFAGIQRDVAQTAAIMDLEKSRARNMMLMIVIPASLGVIGLGTFIYMRKSKKKRSK